MNRFIKDSVKKILLVVLLCGVNVFAASTPQKEVFQNFLIDVEPHGDQKAKFESTGKELIELLDSIVGGLQEGKESLSNISFAFNDLCYLIGDVDKPKPHHIRELEEKIKVLVEFLDGDDKFDEEDAELVQKIRVFTEVFELFLGDLDLGGFGTKILDLLYHKPLELLDKCKYGKEIATGVTAVAIVAAAALCAWCGLGKKKKDDSGGSGEDGGSVDGGSSGLVVDIPESTLVPKPTSTPESTTGQTQRGKGKRKKSEYTPKRSISRKTPIKTPW